MPPPPHQLTEAGAEFWGRFPAEFPELTKGFSAEASLNALHQRLLPEGNFPVVGSCFKPFVGKNRRHVDLNVAMFEDASGKHPDRSEWGLPMPNPEAAYLSLAKYAKSTPYLSARQVAALNLAFNWLERHFGPHMQNARVKTVQEVLTGLEKSTSPGFPWTRKWSTKKALIEEWSGLEEWLEKDWLSLTEEDYRAIFNNSLKEEIRPAAKIAANSIRTFTAGPIEMTVHGNRLFEDMNEKFYASHLQTASVVGFSTCRGGWDRLIRKLKKFKRGQALDESQYDSSLYTFLLWGVCRFRWNMLRPEDQTEDNRKRLVTYYSNLINTIIITSHGVFVMKQGGNPSGSVNTIADNTLILYVLLSYAWIMLAPEELRTYEAFDDKTALALCGDDNTWSADDQVLTWFNASTIIPEWCGIGITTTTNSLGPLPVDELDFLSAHTVYIEGVAVPLYDRNKLLTSLLYSEEPDDPCYTLTRACALLRIGWVDEEFRSYMRELISWLIARYGHILGGDAAWKEALAQFPTEAHCRELFLGEIPRRPLL